MKKEYSIVITTYPNKNKANKIARNLVENKLAACVQIMPMESFYNWKGKLQQDKEFILFIKTKASIYTRLVKYLLEKHSYETPEIIEIPIERGLAAYFSWIDENVERG